MMIDIYKLLLCPNPNQPHYQSHSTVQQYVSIDTTCALLKHSKVPLC